MAFSLSSQRQISRITQHHYAQEFTRGKPPGSLNGPRGVESTHVARRRTPDLSRIRVLQPAEVNDVSNPGTPRPTRSPPVRPIRRRRQASLLVATLVAVPLRRRPSQRAFPAGAACTAAEPVAAGRGNRGRAAFVPSRFAGRRRLAAGDRSAERRPRASSGGTSPRPEAKPTKVPWIIQEPFPAITAWPGTGAISPPPPIRTPKGRYPAAVLGRRLQGRSVAQRRARSGSHEGGESPFVLDVTDAIRAGAAEPPGRPRAQSHARADRRHRAERDAAPQQGPALLGRAAPGTRAASSIRSNCWSCPPVRVEDLFVRARLEDRQRPDPSDACATPARTRCRRSWS